MKVKVRGIYSTAISKLLMDAGIEITQPAEAIKGALGATSEEKPDVMVEDMETKEGVYVYGNEAEAVIDALKGKLKKSIFYREEIGRIYCGIIKNTDQRSKSIVITLPDGEEGVLDLKNFWGYVKPGSKLLVQSKGTYDGKIMLSTQLRLFGEDVIIIKNGFTKMSKGIRSNESKDKLYELSKDLKLKDWGILWVQGAENKEREVLSDELNKLQDKEHEITESFNSCEEPKTLYEGVAKFFVLLGIDDKVVLDEIRKGVMPTITNHHTLKSAGYTILTDFAETLLDKYSEKEMRSKVEETLLRYGPAKDKLYRLAFTRLNGTSFRVDGIVEDMTVDGNDVKSLSLKIRGDWGERKYVIDADKEYMISRKNDAEERTVILKPEIFPKFAKIITLDISSKKEGEDVVINNEDRIDKLIKKGEIQDELKVELEEALNEIKKV